MIFKNNHTYDVLKRIALIVLPAFATLYGALATTWGWPNTEQIVCTIAAIDTFLGAVLGVSNMKYKKAQEDGEEV